MNTMKKLAVTLWNFKGGVGKSTIALVLAEIAAQQDLKVLAIDLDEQQNLAGALSLSQRTFPTLEVRTSFAPEFADEDFDFFVLDTHPAKNNSIKEAICFADIVLVPVLCDYLSILNLRSVFSYLIETGLGNEQLVIIKNCVNALKTSTEVEHALDEHSYLSAGRLPRSNLLVRNIAEGNRWDKYMQGHQRNPFLALYANIWEAFSRMCSGKFHNVWK